MANVEKTNKCICQDGNFEKDDTLFYETCNDGSIEFNYIRHIKYCPVCGSELKIGE